MNQHVVEDMVDYFASRLTPDRVAQINMHLDGCVECAEDFAWADTLYSAKHGFERHIDSERIVQLAMGSELAPTAAEANHFGFCHSCQGELQFERSLSSSSDAALEPPSAVLVRAGALGHAHNKARRTRYLSWKWALAAPALLGVAVAVAVVSRIETQSGGVADLAIRKPLEPLSVSRRVLPDESFASRRDAAADAYVAGRYTEAAIGFEKADEFGATDRDRFECRLYAGSSHLLAGRPHEAIDALEGAMVYTMESDKQETLLWHLAMAFLAAGDAASARQVLFKLAAPGGTHESRATQLLDRLADEQL
jgi:hypothetical protein